MQPTTLPMTMTTIVWMKLSPNAIPRAPRTQLIGAVLLPTQIQNCWIGVESRSSTLTGSIPWKSKCAAVCFAAR